VEWWVCDLYYDSLLWHFCSAHSSFPGRYSHILALASFNLKGFWSLLRSCCTLHGWRLKDLCQNRTKRKHQCLDRNSNPRYQCLHCSSWGLTASEQRDAQFLGDQSLKSTKRKTKSISVGHSLRLRQFIVSCCTASSYQQLNLPLSLLSLRISPFLSSSVHLSRSLQASSFIVF
jgi:hypothetical protein